MIFCHGLVSDTTRKLSHFLPNKQIIYRISSFEEEEHKYSVEQNTTEIIKRNGQRHIWETTEMNTQQADVYN